MPHRSSNTTHEKRVTASTTPVPPFTLFALEALPNLKATNSINVKGGTMLAEAGGAKELLTFSCFGPNDVSF
jgi:hypothetical protein